MDKKEKQAMYKVLLFFAPLVVGGIIAYFVPKYENFAYKHYERGMIISISSAINSTQQSHKSEFKSFVTNKGELGKFYLGLEGVSVYFDVSDIPKALKSELEEDELPFLEKDKYRILIYLQKYSKSAMWYFDSEGNVEKIFRKF